jgi:hypothetical protein
VDRTMAHQFYEEMGYHLFKIQRAYRKLARGPGRREGQQGSHPRPGSTLGPGKRS